MFEDGYVLSDLERKHYVVVETDKPIDECRATFLASGVPDAVQQAYGAALMALDAAIAALAKNPPAPEEFLVTSKEQLAVDAAKAALVAAAYDPRDYPARRVKIDVAQLPAQKVDAVVQFKAAVDAVRPEAYVAKDAAVAAVVEELGISVSKAEKILDPDPKLRADFADIATEEQVDALRVAARDGWAAVVEPVEQSFSPLDPVVLEAASLDALVVTK